MLTVELVPKTCWYKNVRSEVSRKKWDELRHACYSRASGACQICKKPSKRLEAHEIWHYDDKNRRQVLSGIIALCTKCHMCKHWGLSCIRGKEDICIKHMIFVNKWSIEDVALYIEGVFEEWSRRSQHNWELDISWLDK